MKTKICLIVPAVILFTTPQLHAVLEDKIFTSSGQILPGEEWNDVYIYNDDTIVDMLGGGADGIGTYDASTLNVFDGYVNTMTALEFSTANLSGGSVYSLFVWDQAAAYVSGDADIFVPSVSNFGVLNVIGGTVDHLGAIDSGTINLYGGLILDSVAASEDAVINVYGHDLVKMNFGGAYGYGQVYGFWLDHTPFTIDLNGTETYDHISLIPEPASVMLLAAGALLLRRKRK